MTMWPKDPSCNQVVRRLRKYFSLFGKSVKFKSDGGPQFIEKEMQKFLDEYDVEDSQSSPYNPKANGHAECNVQLINNLLFKTGNDLESEKDMNGLAQIRNTPRADSFSSKPGCFWKISKNIGVITC